MEYSFSVIEINKNFHSGLSKTRDCFFQIKNYLDKTEHQSKICAVYGLRRTGKTTLLKQAIESLSEIQKEKTLYIECYNNKTDFYDVVQFIKNKINEGYQYFFIDEITYAEGFQKIATILSDIFVDINEVKIVVTGTDSLGLSLSAQNLMYDRIEFVNTTYITFAEYSRITGIATIDEFIKKGSTLRTNLFDSHQDTQNFIETAIVDNIIHSLQKSEENERYPLVLTEKYSKEAIKCEIERIINKYSQVRTYKAITSQFKSTPLGDARDVVLKHEENGFEMVATLKYQETNAKIAQILGCDTPSGIEDKDISKIYEYLTDIGVFMSIPVYHSYSNNEPDEPLEMMVHPGMFHSNIKYTLGELIKDSSWIQADDNTKRIIINKAYESAMGKIMENIIIADVYHLLCSGKNVQKEDLFGENTGRWYVSKLNQNINGQTHEADIIIFDKERKESYLFEIKHSSKNVPEQSIHLENNDFIDYIENNFGPIKGRAVLYNGKTTEETPVPRISAKDFLIQIYQDSKSPDFTLDKSLLTICPQNIGEIDNVHQIHLDDDWER